MREALVSSAPVLIISKDQLALDQPRPLRALLLGLRETRLPQRAAQRRSLRR